MALTVGILNIIEYLEGREAYQKAVMIRKGRETAKGVRVKKGENGFLTDTFSYEGKPHTKKVRLVWERLFCNGSGNCRRGCGGMGACIDGCPKGKQRAKGGHRCSFYVNLTLYSDNLNEWSVEFFGSHVHPVDVWTPPEKNMLRSPTLKPASKRPVRHLYSPTQLTNAYKACIEEKMPVFRASRLYGVPLTTLRDRVDQRIPIDATRSGPAPMFSQLEEAKLVNHIKGMSHVGYGYTRAEITNMATDYAVHMGKRDKKEKGLTMNWFYGFMRRWPELHVVKPSGLSEQRARCASSDTIINYYEELETVMTKYDLTNQPQLIYNIDEKGINTEFRPQHVVAGRGYHPQVVMSERSKNVTVIGAGNALGNQIPPFFVFPGQRMLPELMEGKSVGSNGTVTASGWSNSDVFRTYLQEHFMKYIQRNNREDHILVLYDGHKSHISLGLIDWAKANNVILFVLPPHCSHILQPMDVGCFGPFQVKYNQECQTFLRVKGRGVTRYDVCQLACRVYTAALSLSQKQESTLYKQHQI